MYQRGYRAFCILLLTGAFATGAQAQDPVPRGEFNVMRFTPAPGSQNYFQTEGASTAGHLQPSAGLILDYGHQPFLLWNANCDANGENCVVADGRSELVSYIAAAHLSGSLTLYDRIQVGAVLPLAITSGQEFSYTAPSGDPITLRGGTAFSLADPRLHVKGRIFTDAASGVSIAASAFLTFPTGQPIATGRYVGDPTLTFGGSAIVEWISNNLRLAANVGGSWREEQDLFSTHVGPQLSYSAAGSYVITPLISGYAELNGASTFSDQVDEHWLEWRLGGRLRLDDFEVSLAGGSGLIAGVGTPVFRVLAGVAWAPFRADRDGDGVEDAEDGCPTEAEDADGFEDLDGCPEADNDGDGIADTDDPCPDQAEDIDGFEDEDGCPDTDNDGDGIHDGYDSCPNDAEDFDEDRDEDGCPDLDTDRDGIADADDQCPAEPEDFDGFGDEDGCPETDFDGDSILDDVDACPDQAEDADGFEDEDGCPEEGTAPTEEVAPPRRHRRGR